MAPIGNCAICGNFGPLSFEHVPPRAAFNDRPAFVTTFMDRVLEGKAGQHPRGRLQQRGLGAYTLCTRCNNDTGTWYGPQFLEWCAGAMEWLRAGGGRSELVQVRRCEPLAVIKQVVTMFCSIDARIFGGTAAPFLLDRRRRYLWPRLRFFMYFNLAGDPRSVPLIGRGGTGPFTMLSEFSFPPFGYVLTLEGAGPPDPRLFEITWFSSCRYGESRLVEMRMPVLETASPFPGDYRSKEQLEIDTRAGLAMMRERELREKERSK